jgi:phosphatidylserine synthase
MPLSTLGEAASRYYGFALMALVGILALLMVSTIRYVSAKTGSKGRKGFLLVLFLAGIGMAIWLYSQYTLLILAGAYVAHGLLLFVIRPFIVKPKMTEQQ